MFAWIKKQKHREILKLLHQNRSFLLFYTNLKTLDSDAKNWLFSIEKIADEYVQSGDVSFENHKFLLEMNKKIRILHERHDPNILMHKSGLTTKKPDSFDQKYQPIMGWKKYYEGSGL